MLFLNFCFCCNIFFEFFGVILRVAFVDSFISTRFRSVDTSRARFCFIMMLCILLVVCLCFVFFLCVGIFFDV